MLGIDRKQMEAERLARLAKKRGADKVTSDAISQPRKVQRTSPAPSAASLCNVSPPSRAAPKAYPPSTTGTASAIDVNPSVSPSSIEYPCGAVRRTFCLNQPRDGTDISLTEVLEPATCNVAVISSWQLDLDFLFSKLNFPRSGAKLYMIMHSKHASDQETWRRDAAQLSKNIRLCFPTIPKGPGGVMHSKLMLLFHPEKLRVVVPSANMMDYDWGETGVMENVVFLIDLPRLPADRQGSENDTLTPFALDLVEYLEAQGVEQDVRDGVLKFDFSNTGHLAMVNTIAGTHSEEDAKKTGLAQLAGTVRSLGLATSVDERVEIDFAASSIGKLDSKIFSDLYSAFGGINPLPNQSADAVDIDQCFRVHFPSFETVKASLGGPENAGTLFFAPQKIDSSNSYALNRMRDAQSTRRGLLSHAKYALVRTQKHAFVYVGSANASQAAWGRLTQGKRQGAEVKLTASNWECGILMRLEDVEEAEDGGVVALEEIEKRVPLMFEIPGESYVKENGECRKPHFLRSLTAKYVDSGSC